MRKPQGKIANASKLRQVRRKLSIRKKVIGTAERPRVCTVKTNKNICVQVVNDDDGKTLFSVQTFGKNAVGKSANKESAKAVGEAVGLKLKENKIESIVFDRNGNIYTGVVKTVADSLREAGIKF